MRTATRVTNLLSKEEAPFLGRDDKPLDPRTQGVQAWRLPVDGHRVCGGARHPALTVCSAGWGNPGLNP